VNSTPNYQITETDLAALEKAVADLHECASMSPSYFTPRVQVATEQAKEILSNVRWRYGPFSEVHHMPDASRNGDEQ